MAIANTAVWEVRSGGSNNNGGGFITGASGTDYSQQDAAQYALTGVTSSGAGAVFLTASAAADMVGNICQVISGTNFTTGFYQITSVSAGVSVTVDRSITTGAGASGVINIGGALATIQAGLDRLTVDQTLYVKSATYAISSALALPSLSQTQYGTRAIGYTTTRGDEGRPTVQVTTAINGINLNQSGFQLMNFAFTGAGSGLVGIDSSVSFVFMYNCTVSGFATGISSTGVSSIMKCSVTTATTRGFYVQTANVLYCTASANTCSGFVLSSPEARFVGCISINNTGASSDGFAMNGHHSMTLINCLAYGNGRDGIRFDTVYGQNLNASLSNCIMAKNGGYGFNPTSTPISKSNPWINYNGFWSNTSGAYSSNYTSSANNVAITGTDPTNDPFVDKASGNFALNSTAGAGALLRAAGFPGTMASTTGYLDIGTFQHADPVSVTVGIPIG